MYRTLVGPVLGGRRGALALGPAPNATLPHGARPGPPRRVEGPLPRTYHRRNDAAARGKPAGAEAPKDGVDAQSVRTKPTG